MANASTTTLTYSPDKKLLNITIETTESFTWAYISDNLKSLANNLEKESDNEPSPNPVPVLSAIPNNPGNDTGNAEPLQQSITEIKSLRDTPSFTEWYNKGNGAV